MRAHALDDAAHPGRYLTGIDPACRARDVAHQAGREVEFLEDPQHREQLTEVGRHRLLQREQLVHTVLDVEHSRRDLGVVLVDAVDQQQVAVEDGLGGCADLLGRLGRELHHVAAHFLQPFVV